jgi:predicted  nucleic acid-binding Zn-ribbon protein
MAHRCVKCGRIYPSAAPEILKGCSCGSHYFFFFREGDVEALQKTEKLTRNEREEIMKDVKKIVGPEMEKPIILNIESIRVRGPGKFELDLVNILKRKPVVYKLEEGRYVIDLASTFQMRKNLKTTEGEKALEEELDGIATKKEAESESHEENNNVEEFDVPEDKNEEKESSKDKEELKKEADLIEKNLED